MNAPKVFISYAHSSPQHKQVVADLADKLRSMSLEITLDTDVKTPMGPPEGWPRWMKRQIRDADWVLIFFDEVYRRRFDGEEEPGKGLGATWEGAIITQQFYRTAATNAFFQTVLQHRLLGRVPHIGSPDRTRWHVSTHR